MHTPLRLAVLVSAGGTTLQNLLDRIADGRLAARIELVIGSRPDAFGLERARRAGVPTALVSRKDYSDRAAFSAANFDLCRKCGADLVCLAGYLQLLTIPDDFRHRVMNIHPSLLPAFGGHGMYGHHVHEAVLAHGVKVTGCTVHFADNEYDRGPIVVQKTVAVADDDHPDSLAAKVYELECAAYPEAIALFAAGRLRVEGRRVLVEPGR
jgi:phosphoribosylglycinamide formyltransferase-1